MKGITNYHDAQTEHVSLPDDFIRRVLGNPRSGPKAIVQASLSAQALEEDRRATALDDMKILEGWWP